MPKKLISIALCLVMLLSVLPVGVSAASEEHRPVKGQYVTVGNAHRLKCTVDGCAEKHDKRGYEYHTASFGKWAIVDNTHERKCTKCTITESGEHSGEYQQTADKQSHFKNCSTCGTEMVPVTNHAGTWTQTAETHSMNCTTCSLPMVDATPHSGTWENTEDGLKHFKNCSACGAQMVAEAEHTVTEWTEGTDGNHSGTCTVCGASVTQVHNFGDWQYDKDSHMRVCSGCHEQEGPVAHVLPETWTNVPDDNVNHEKVCGVCGYVHTEPHKYGAWQKGEENHYRVCESCNHTETVAHEFGTWSDAGETHERTCDTCGYVQSEEHNLEDKWHAKKEDDGKHYKDCRTCEHVASEDHSYTWNVIEKGKDAGKHEGKCECKHRVTHAANPADNWTPNGDVHEKACEDCTLVVKRAAHVLQQKSDDAQHWDQCIECGAVIGEKVDHEFTTPWTEVDEKEHSRKCTVCEFTQTEKHNFAENPYICADCDYAEQGHESYKMNEVTPEWEAGSGVGAKFRSSAEFESFVTVLLDGTELSSGDYTVHSGSTVVVLQPKLLDTLKVGEHTVSIVSYTSTGKMAVSAKFTIVRGAEEHLVVFKMNGHGNRIQPQVVKDGECVEKPHNPKEKGYIFCGWYTDHHLHHKFDFSTEIHEDTVLYAKWIKASPVPKTGDNSNTALWASVLVAGLAITGMALIPQNKKIGK